MWVVLEVILLLYILIYSGSAKQNPFRDPNICGSPKCDAPFAKFSFNNNIYRYQYSIDLKSAFSGTENNASSLFLQSSIEIFYPKPCEGFLRITDVKLWGNELPEKSSEVTNVRLNSEEEDYYGEFGGTGRDDQTYEDFDQMHPSTFEIAKDLKKHILRFSFHDGLIAEICPSSAEAVWTLNFKRGILSAFQNTMLRFDIDHNATEIDVSGECKVQYLLESTNDVFIRIRKTKHISTCRNRYSTHSILQSTPYNFYKDKAVWPLLDSKSHCDVIVNNNLYQEITCQEYHQLRAFSKNNSGALTKVTSRLILQERESHTNSKRIAEYDELVPKRVTLVFDHTPSVKRTHSEIKLARDQLKDICSLGFPNIQREFITAFTNFIVTMKQLDYEALTQLLARSTSICEKGKYHILDSLPYIGSSASYQLMRDQLLTNSVSKRMALNWLKSMAFIQRPDEDTVETFYTILEFSRDKTEPEYTLSASAVIHSYCRRNSHCSQNIRVKAITGSLESEFIHLLKSYRGERYLYERMIVNIKSLGNIGILSRYFVEQLSRLIVNEVAPIGIRLESVFAFRRTDCIQHRSIFLSVYSNYTINSEVRIACYLQAMICPNYFTIKSIKAILKSEEINQVGSFVWSHLKNLAKSSSPINVEVQSLLFDNDLSDKYNMDMRKFSRNFQQNFFSDEYNFGSTTDVNLIFGTESYLPRMMMLNLTTNIFGHSVNFLELSTRAEGFETIFSSFFKTDQLLNEYKYFKKNGLNKVWAFFKNWLNRDRNPYYDMSNNSTNEHHMRNNTQFGSRKCNQKCLSKMKDVTEHREIFQTLIKNVGYKLNYDYNTPKVELGLRIFGNDLHFFNLNGIPELLEFFKEFDVLQQIYNVLSGKEAIYTKSKVFLEASYVVPLAVGLPLSIDIFGASAVDLRISGKLEKFGNLSGDWNFDMKGTIKPTILIDLVGRMTSDLFYTHSGIKVKSSLYSNTEVEGIMKVRGHSLVSFSFSLPQNRSELLSLHSEILKMAGNKYELQRGVEGRKTNSTCTWPLLDTVIGLKICADYSAPYLSNTKEATYPYLLLSGPLNFSIILAKSDETAKTWTFEYKSMREQKDIKMSLLFFTPGSSFKRLIVANVSVIPESLNASISFIHGNNKASVISQYNVNNTYRVFNFLLDTNGNRSLDLKTELHRQQIRNIYIYKPKMLLAVNGINITGAVGTVRFNEKNGVSQSDVDFSFETRRLQMLIRGIIVQSEISKSANITFNYRFEANKIESIVIEGRLINTGDKDKIEYNGKIKLQASAHPKVNFASNVTWRSLKGHTELIWACNSPEDFGDPETTSIIRLLLIRSYSGANIWDGLRSHASFSVAIPRSKINTKLLIKHEERYKNGTEHNIIVGLSLNPEREATLLFSLMLPRQPLLTFDVFINISITRFSSCFGHLMFTEQLPKTYLVNFNGTWFTEKSVAIKASYKDHNRHFQVLKVIMESASFETISLYASYIQNETVSYNSLHLKYGGVPYSFTAQTNLQSGPIKTITCEIRIYIKERKYWLNTSMLLKQPLALQMEIHLDKIRDIYVESSAMYLDEKKELSVELNWDMNRDPSQKLRLSMEYLKPSNKSIVKILVSYPDRTLSCSFNESSQGPIYHGDVYLSWDINEAVIAKYYVGIIPGKSINNWIHAEILTSFKGWHKNTLDAGIYNYGALYLTNMSLIWGENHNFGVVYKYDVNIDEIPITLDVRFVLNSSFIEMPAIALELNHRNDESQFFTGMILRYNNGNETFKSYNLKSIWNLNKTLQCKNVSGTVLITSPHTDFWKGYLVTKFILKDNKEIRGAASLTINLLDITLSVDGYVNKVNDNMILINITTPLNTLRNIKGRLGFIEKRRYLVADIQTSSSALGIEALFDIISLIDFDVKFSVAIPFISLKQMGVFTKLKRDTIDMRVKWNNTVVGFIGVWYMNDINDFEYSCKLFTPLRDFEENGYIVKFYKKESVALNLYCKLSRYNLGVSINGKPKSLISKQLGNKIFDLEATFDDDFKLPALVFNETHLIEYEEFVAYNIILQLDLLIWPTIEGVIDVEEILDYYFAVVNFKLPQGYIYIRNSLYYPDYFNIVNILDLKTPFVGMEEVKLIFDHRVDISLKSLNEKIYYVFNNANKTTMTRSKKTGCELTYNEMSSVILPPEHYLKIMLTLPNGDEINITGKIHLEELRFISSLNVSAWRTRLAVAAELETEENFCEGSFNALLTENSITQYKCNLFFKQDFSRVNNSLNIKIDIDNKNQISKLEAQSVWQIENGNDKIISVGKVLTNILPIKTFEYSFLLNKRRTPQLNLDFRFLNQHDIQIDCGLRSTQNDEVFNMEMWTPIQNFKNISLHGTLRRTSSKQYKIEGVLYRDMEVYTVNGSMNMRDDVPVKTHLQIQLMSNRPESIIEIKIKQKNNFSESFEMQVNAMENEKSCAISGDYFYDQLTGFNFSMLIVSTEPAANRIYIASNWQYIEINRTFANLCLETPWRDMGIGNVKLWAKIHRKADQGKVEGGYSIVSHKGNGNLEWSMKPEEDIRLLIESFINHPTANYSYLLTELKYINPNKNFKELEFGGILNFNNELNFQLSGTLNFVSTDDIEFGIISQWPKSNDGVQELKCTYRGNLISDEGRNLDVFVEIKYDGKKSKRRSRTCLSYTNDTDIRSIVNVEWGIADDIIIYKADLQILIKSKARRDFIFELITPKFGSNSTLYLIGSYDKKEEYYHFTNWSIDYPYTNRVADMNFAIQSLSDLKGYLNCTTPFLRSNWCKIALNFSTFGDNSHRFCRVDWPSDFSFIRLQKNYTLSKLGPILEGTIEVEVPLNTRHRADIIYNLNEKAVIHKGEIKVLYNKKLVLNGTYQSKKQNSISSRKVTDITLENDIKPIGIHLVNSSVSWEDIRKHSSLKRIEIFDLANPKKFNLTFELNAVSSKTKSDIKLLAIYPNRTVILTVYNENSNNYTTQRRGKIELSKAEWVGYNIVVGNNNTKNRGYNFEAELSYPKRKLYMDGFYLITLNELNVNMTFGLSNTARDKSSLETCILWRSESLLQDDLDNKTLLFTLRHNLLKKDITLKGRFYRGARELIKTNVLIEYSDKLEHSVIIRTSLVNLGNQSDLTKYAINFLAYHGASEVDVQFNGSTTARSSYLQVETRSLYKKDYFPEKHRLLLALFDFNNKEVEYMCKSSYQTVRLWMQPNMNYPIYGLNATLWNTPDTNNSGYIYFDIFQKEAHMYFNLTEDNTHNLIMYGSIPNARNIYLDIWRNYEELSIVDVASYIKLNHSRQLSGRFHWRPYIEKEIKEKIITIKEAILNSFTENFEFWTKTFYVETLSALSVVWETSKEYNEDFVNDIKRIKVLAEDLDDFRMFVNKSYEDDDFYLKTILNYTLTLVDDKAFQDHIGSLPTIIGEIQQVLGETGKTLRKSLVEFIDMITATYNSIINAITSFFHGESVKHLTDLLTKGFEKYEKFVKDLHISCINQTEYILTNFSYLVSTYLKGVLKRIEPHIFKVMSFLEETVWELSKELFNLIYERTNELAESTYFNQISSFTQDMEKLYRDIKSNDIITNFKKYTSIIWRFVKEKYHKLVPFGSEINEVIQELWYEIKELEKIRQIKAVVKKCNEFKLNLEWIAGEVRANEYLHKLYRLMRNKLNSYSLNALEVANMYREAKTKFIFDPETGQIDFEQKLPMSWHAFNETPNFYEISEYQTVMKIKNMLTVNNVSIFRHIYDIRSYLDLKIWLPSYFSRALLINTGFYITFDKRLVSLNMDLLKLANCSYILSHDFWNNSFTLFLDVSVIYNKNKTLPGTKFILIAKQHMFQIDLSTDTFTLNGDSNPLLPITLNGVLVHRQADTLSINSKDGYKIECNMEFGLCWFEISSRFFGQTAGLLGTMNNEPYDDFITPFNRIEKSQNNFVEAWSTNLCTKTIPVKASVNITEELTETCHQLFSELTHCVDFVDPSPFWNICVKSAYKSKREHLSDLTSLKRSCSAALAYIEMCKLSKIPMRVPHQCVFCELANGTLVPESTFVEYTISNESRSSDIVFLIEATDCSTHTKGNKSIETILTALEEQLQEHNFINNRYAVISFGVQLSPFIISKGNATFVSSFYELRKYFTHVMNFINNDNAPHEDSDVLQAISTASTLNFRPGIAKIFILLSCSRCSVNQFRFDYSSILQYMNEEGVSLHVITYTDFDFDKPRKSRLLFGFDKQFAYSTRFPEGDREMRRGIQISKAKLGICVPLALDAGGSVFSMNRALSDRKNSLKRFATIFAKRVMKSTAVPRGNQMCECIGHKAGMAYMVCSSKKMPDQESDFEANDSDFSDLGWQSADYELE